LDATVFSQRWLDELREPTVKRRSFNAETPLPLVFVENVTQGAREAISSAL
jgi:hypothetical protein